MCTPCVTITQIKKWSIFRSQQAPSCPYSANIPSKVITILTSITSPWVGFACSWISYKWNLTVCILLCLASFTQHEVVRFIYVVVWSSDLLFFMAVLYSRIWDDHYLPFLLLVDIHAVSSLELFYDDSVLLPGDNSRSCSGIQNLLPQIHCSSCVCSFVPPTPQCFGPSAV